MASYRFHVGVVSRGNGQSVVAKAAYNAREALRDDRTGEMKDYSRGAGLEFSGLFLPKDSPEWAQDRASLWNMVERREDEQLNKRNREQAQLARSLELNLPHELDADQRRQIVRDYVREQFTRNGIIADVAIHAPHGKGDERNYHVHILLTLREIDGDRFAAKKNRDWNSKELMVHWREKWAELGARYLENAGFRQEAERYSYAHLDLKEQRREAARRGDHEHAENLDREATTHMGPRVAAMEKRGMETERGEVHSATVEENKLREELREVEKQIAVEVEKQEREAEERKNTVPPPPGRTAGEIRMAYSLTSTGQEFVGALEDRGFIVAAATAVDIEIERIRNGVTENWQLLREDEIVVINHYGDLYRLTERNTGDNRRERDEYLKDVDRASLLTVTQARTVAGDLRRHWHDERDIREAQSEIRFSTDRERTGPQNDDKQREVRDRAERMSMLNEMSSVADESRQTVLDWAERRTMANERAAERTLTRDS